MTRNSITGQIKAISIIVAMQNFIPDRRALSAEKKSAPAPVNAEIYKSAWLREQQASAHAAKMTRSQPRPLNRKKHSKKKHLESRPAGSRLAGRGASGPWPQPAHLRPSRSPRGKPAALCPPGHVCSRHESSSLRKKEPLCPLSLNCKSSKTTQKYRIL